MLTQLCALNRLEDTQWLVGSSMPDEMTTKPGLGKVPPPFIQPPVYHSQYELNMINIACLENPGKGGEGSDRIKTLRGRCCLPDEQAACEAGRHLH